MWRIPIYAGLCGFDLTTSARLFFVGREARKSFPQSLKMGGGDWGPPPRFTGAELLSEPPPPPRGGWAFLGHWVC